VNQKLLSQFSTTAKNYDGVLNSNIESIINSIFCYIVSPVLLRFPASDPFGIFKLTFLTYCFAEILLSYQTSHLQFCANLL